MNASGIGTGTKPLILVTNDDGIESPGLRAAAEAVFELGDLLIAAPIDQQTSASRGYPKRPDNGRITEVKLQISDTSVRAFGICGSPAQVVSHAILELAPMRPRLCVSGINYGENVGLSIIASGTVGAALEANTYDIPACAVSLEVDVSQQHTSEYALKNWAIAQLHLRRVAKYFLNTPFDARLAALNINVPACATHDTPIRITHQSRQNYFVFAKPSADRVLSQPQKLSAIIEIDREQLERNSDIEAVVVDHVVSITPLTWNMTARDVDLTDLTQNLQ